MKNNRFIINFFHALLVSIFTFNLLPAFALASSSTVQNYQGGNDQKLMASLSCKGGSEIPGMNTDSIDCLLAGYGLSLRKMLFLPAYEQKKIMGSGTVLHFILSPQNQLYASTSFDSKTSQSVRVLAANTGDITDQILTAAPEYFSDNLILSTDMIKSATTSNLPGGFKIPFLTGASTTQASPVDKQTAVNTLSFDSVIAPMTYQKNPDNNKSTSAASAQELAATTFIQYVSGLVNPMRTANFDKMVLPSDGKYSSKESYLIDLQKKPEVRDYLAALRNYTAQLSVGISNFYYLYHERMPISDPDTLDLAKAIMSKSTSVTPAVNPAPTNDVSPLEVMQYIATSRVGNDKWYEAVQNAAPATLLRESLFILAEIPPMLFQLHLDLERILATMSAMQIQQANGNRLMLETQRDKVDKILTSPEESTSELKAASDKASSDVDQAEINAAKDVVKQQ